MCELFLSHKCVSVGFIPLMCAVRAGAAVMPGLARQLCSDICLVAGNMPPSRNTRLWKTGSMESWEGGRSLNPQGLAFENEIKL